MNYFAHGCEHVHDPYFLAGTAVPDWLSVVDRGVRARAKGASKLIDDSDPRVAAAARGIVRHHRDDDWFHQTAAFYTLNTTFSAMFRTALADSEGFRPAFLGHILVELLLDTVLMNRLPGRIDAYYSALEAIDPAVMEQVVNRISARPTDRLALLIPRFIAERFLYDYHDDAKLLHRLNQVMRRVQLPVLPDTVAREFPEMRRLVTERADDLLTPPPEFSQAPLASGETP